MITVVLADDYPVTRAGIRTILSQEPNISIIGEAEDGFQTKRLVARLRPRILLLDLVMPGPRPADIEKWVRKNYPETITLILTAHARDVYLASMVDAGVSGFLTKNRSIEQLIEAIKAAARGDRLITREQYDRVSEWKETVGKRWESLTDREKEVTRLLAQGLKNSAIARLLDVTVKTVEYHVTNILGKLAMNSRKDVMIWVEKYLSDDIDK